MIVHSSSGIRGDLFDESVFPPRKIRWARWYDTETGEYEAFRIDPRDAKRLGIKLSGMVYRGKGKLRFVKHHVEAERTIDYQPSLPSSFQRKGRRCVIDPQRKCEHKDCYRLAEWVTGDDKLTTPAEVNGRRYETGEIIREHYWCSFHYQMPRQIYQDGSSDPIDVQCGRPE